MIGAGNPVPTFIERRLNALAVKNQELVVSLAYGQSHNLHPSIRIIRHGNFGQMGMTDFLKFMLYLVAHPIGFLHILRVVPAEMWSTRLKLAIRFFPLSLVRQIDVIHVQWLGLVPDVYWLKLLLKAPILASVRGSQVTVYPITKVGFQAIVKKAIAHSDFLHLVGRDLAGYCLKLGAQNEQLHVNYNGIAVNRFMAENNRQSHNAFIMITTGGLIWRKGILFQLLIVKSLTEVGIPARLLVIGDGPDREGLVYITNQMELSEVVSYLGRLEEQDVITNLQNADVYISTSAAEGLPNSMVEAASCGLPVVTFSCEGVREIVEDGISGFVVPYGDIAYMSLRLQELWHNMDMRKRMGEASRSRVTKYFDQDIQVDEMINLYRKMIKQFSKNQPGK